MNDHPMNDHPMNDGATDERIVLLSSYLDDRVTAGERASIEGDPRAMADVARLTRARDSTARVEPPDADARERALAAALVAFDGAEVDDHATVVPLLRRRPGQRVLAVAAACAAVAALGVVAATVLGGSEDDSSTTGDAAVARSSDAAPADEPGGTDEALSSADTGDDTGDGGAESEAATGPESGADAAGTTDVGTVDEATLAAVVQSLLDEPAASTAATTCVDVVTPLLGTGDYLGVPVLLGPDPDRRLARAVDAGDCSVVAEVPLPPGS
ncbi:MAG: hypothetical protein WD225_07920 [Ilumatobacteraceae bacterium]